MTALLMAATPEAARVLLDHGADVEMRCLDHESTPAQYAIPYRQDVCHYLLKRGAEPDIFMACVLGDQVLVKRLLKQDPACLQQRIGKGRFVTTQSQGQHIYVYNLSYTETPFS